MERLIPAQFHADVLCWTQGFEVQKIEVFRSCVKNNPDMDYLQHPYLNSEYPVDAA